MISKKINQIKYNYEYISKREIIIFNYCTHGNLLTTTKIFSYTNRRNLCLKCSMEERDMENAENQGDLLKILKNPKNKISKDKLFLWYPKIFNRINTYPGKWRQKVYMFINNIKKVPKCKCGNEVSFDEKRIKNFQLDCEGCRRSRGSKIKQLDSSEKKWQRIFREYFDIHNAIIEKNEKYSLLLKIGNQRIEIKKRNIHHLKKIGILSHKFINNNIETNKWTNEFKTHWKKYKMFSEKIISEKYPHIWKLLLITKEKNNIETIAETKFFINNNFKKAKCTKCDNLVSFNKSGYSYNINCNRHKYLVFSSTGENEIKQFISNNYNGLIINNSRNIINSEIDIYLPDLNLAFEFNGLYWHSDLFKSKEFHYNKWDQARKKNIQLINIWEDDWINKKEIIKSIILNKIGLSKKIYARKTQIKEINYYSTQIFLEKNHLQGANPSSINLALFYDNDMISLMTFGKKRMILKSKSLEGEYELLRFCNKLGLSITGGSSKLFKYFIKNFNPSKIISYANLDISNGNMYDILGFTKISHSLNYWWAKDQKYHRSNFMKYKLVKEGADPLKTGDEIMREKGYNKIWGTGNLKYEFLSV